MADVYGLADKDNDKTLYKNFGELDELWYIIPSLPFPTEDQT